MATYATAGMYPPITDSYIPAFLLSDVVNNEKDITLYFQFSSFTNPDDVTEIHVSFDRQDNYQTVFNDPYIRGIWISQPWDAEENKVDEPGYENYYKVVIPNNVLVKPQFTYSLYYKIQIRFSKINFAGARTAETISNYLLDTENMNSFSEWSTVSLARFITDPHISLNVNGDEDELTEQVRNITSSMASLHGKFSTTFTTITINPDTQEKEEETKITEDENLQSYRFILKNEDMTETYCDSGIIQTNKNNGANDIVYTIPYSLEEDEIYTIVLTYTTRNLYTDTKIYQLRNVLHKKSWGEIEVGIDSVTNTVIGKLNINLSNLLEDDTIIIRRASNLDDYVKWDTVYMKHFDAPAASFSYNDFTIESGTMYRYEINLLRGQDTYATIIEKVLSIFDDSFLTGEGTQLSVKFNPNISSYRRNLSDNTTTTIGSKYPYISRKGNTDYRTFSLSGTIAYEMDNQHQFTTRSAIYKDEIEIYGSYFVNHYMNASNDRLTQRKFRELVLDYLCSDIPKLFRSTPEGNILVRITDVNLTPNNTVGRMLFDFTCNATEIGEASVENFKLYKVQDFGEA